MIFNQQCPCAGRYYEPLSNDSGFFMPVFRRCVKGNEMKVTLDDHSAEVLAALESACQRALETCGLVAEGYAKKLVNSPGKFGTGALRNSITHTVTNSGERAAYVGTDSEYAIYVEMGTGKYVTGGLQGRKRQLAHDARSTRTAGYQARRGRSRAAISKNYQK